MKFIRVLSFLVFCLGLTNYAFAEQVNIGVSAPLSGDLAEYGTAVRNGFELAKLKYPNEASRYNFIFDDNQYNSKIAVTGFEKLTNSNNISLLYVWGESPYYSISYSAERKKIPTVAMSIDDSPAVGKTYSMRSVNPPSEFAKLCILYLKKNSFNNLAIIKVDDPFFVAMANAVKSNLLEGQKVVFHETVSITDQDFKSIILKMKNKDIDAIGLYLTSRQAGVFAAQLGNFEVKKQIFGTDIFESKHEVSLAKGQLEGAIYANINVSKEFLDFHNEHIKMPVQVSYAYNAYLFFESVLKSPPQLNWQDAKTVMSYLKDYKKSDSEYVYEFGPEVGAYYSSKILLKKVVNDEFIVVD